MFTIVFFGCRTDNPTITILFDKVDVLQVGAKVYCQGKPVGEVIDLDEVQHKIAVKIQLEEGARIPIGSTFVLNPSLLGSADISIEPSSDPTYILSKDTVLGEFNQNALFDNLTTDTAKRKKINESIKKIKEGMKGIIEASKNDTIQALRP
ncbi:MlaD family protein [Paraflavitalea sp. CAU 1676]|uniref:MlaD family protein n=1 Tax=Paraflavitalea sp. CAU 1676 TaxID=3032598 RepID=UPI0023DA9F12|nr:MlaD family protein [Paraflavitalea sp. CAU 1676]MDF2193468.1 MlaD family protein [Paraflavitalea sp. CAU 1676]